jgi:hypothetical protein
MVCNRRSNQQSHFSHLRVAWSADVVIRFDVVIRLVKIKIASYKASDEPMSSSKSPCFQQKCSLKAASADRLYASPWEMAIQSRNGAISLNAFDKKFCPFLTYGSKQARYN